MSLKVNKSLLAGAASALLCAVCLALYLTQVNGEVERARAEALARYGGEQLEVVVANRDIAAGEVVGDSMVDSRLWIADLLPAGAITSREDVVGKKLGSSVLEGEVISSKRLYESSSSLDIPLGLTAVSIPVRDVQAVGGAIEAGMAVDLYATGSTATVLLVEDALVLATSLAEAEAYSSPSVSWITLAVDPASVTELVAAAQNLELYLTLPNEPVDLALDEREAATGGEDRHVAEGAQGGEAFMDEVTASEDAAGFDPASSVDGSTEEPVEGPEADSAGLSEVAAEDGEEA